MCKPYVEMVGAVDYRPLRACACLVTLMLRQQLSLIQGHKRSYKLIAQQARCAPA